MADLEAMPIDSSFYITVCESDDSGYSKDVHQKVDNIWSALAQITDWDLYDGRVFQLKNLFPDHMEGNFVRYRYYYAQSRHPELREDLQITLAAVTGVLKSGDRYLLGKRSHRVTQFPEQWEFAPAGGISIDYLKDHRVNYEKQLLDELDEEVGMDIDFVTELTPFLLIWDRKEMVIDICAQIEVDELGMATASYISPEYVAYEWLKKEEIARFLKDRDAIPTTHEILQHLYT